MVNDLQLAANRMRNWALRDSLLRTFVWFGTAAVVLTEAMSLFHLLRPIPIAIAWCLVGWLVWRGQSWPLRPRSCGRLAFALAAIPAAIAAVVAFTAILSPPNSADAMAYHLPRVIYWAQSGSVAFFPTPYFNQVMLQPMAEYVMLHTYLLTGGDHLVNLVAWGAFVGCLVGVSSIAAEFGLSPRAQAIAALICATLPSAILQASGAKNDFVLALWLVCAVYFAMKRDALLLGLAAGLALATKATAYLFLPPMLLALCVWQRKQLAWIAAGVLLLNTPQYIRNIRLSGFPLGFDSAQGDGVFRWRNEHPGWQSLVSNVLRNTSEQLGARSPNWNNSVFDAVVRTHRALGIDPDDPATTWPGSRFAPPVNANHEANANNRWHLLLYAIAAVFTVRNRQWRPYAAGLLAAFLLFCLYLKWQPFLARLELPLFVLAAPLGAWILDRLRPQWLALLVCAFLVSGARLPLFANWIRPLTGPHSLFKESRVENYFNDMGQWNNQASYVESVDRVARSGCRVVEIDISENQLEYPFQALLRERDPRVIFTHAGTPRPCAVLCPDCIGNQKKIEIYRDVGTPIEIGRFLLFQPRYDRPNP
jgi:hypothetical protein